MILIRKTYIHGTFRTNIQFLFTIVQSMLQQCNVSTNQDSSCQFSFPQVQPNLNANNKT